MQNIFTFKNNLKFLVTALFVLSGSLVAAQSYTSQEITFNGLGLRAVATSPQDNYFLFTRYPEGNSTLNRYFVFRRADAFIAEIFPDAELLPEGISDSGTVFFSGSFGGGPSCSTRNPKGFLIKKYELDGTKSELYQAPDGAQLQGFFLSSRGIFITIATGSYQQSGGRNPQCFLQAQETKVYQVDPNIGSLKEILGLGGAESLSISFEELPDDKIVAIQASFSNFTQKSWFVVGTDGTAVKQSWNGSGIESLNGSYQGKIFVTKLFNHGTLYKLINPSTGEETDLDLDASTLQHGIYPLAFAKGNLIVGQGNFVTKPNENSYYFSDYKIFSRTPSAFIESVMCSASLLYRVTTGPILLPLADGSFLATVSRTDRPENEASLSDATLLFSPSAQPSLNTCADLAVSFAKCGSTFKPTNIDGHYFAKSKLKHAETCSMNVTVTFDGKPLPQAKFTRGPEGHGQKNFYTSEAGTVKIKLPARKLCERGGELEVLVGSGSSLIRRGGINVVSPSGCASN